MSDANVYAPSTRPMFDPTAVRGQSTNRATRYVEFPRFSFSGFVDSLLPSPRWSMDGAMRLVEFHYTMDAGTIMDIDILVNGSVAFSLATHPGVSWNSIPIDVLVVLNDRIQLQITQLPDPEGAFYTEPWNLSVVLRPYTTAYQPI